MASVLFKVEEFYGKVWGGLVFPELLRRTGSLRSYFFGKEQNQVAFQQNMGVPVQSEFAVRLEEEVLRLTIPPVLTVQGSINVIETAVAGLDGSIKEIASTADYSISIKGVLVAGQSIEVLQEGFRYKLNPNEFPERELRQLRRFFEAKKAVEVIESRFLSFFNIKKLLFKSLNFPELEGYAFALPFEIEAVSDTEYTLVLE